MDAENDETESKMEDYEMVGQIERGSSGTAFLARHIIEKKKYIVKKIRLSKHTDKFKCAVLREMNSFAKLKHPYIVEYKDFWMDEGDCICTVTDHCEGGDLYEMVRKSGGKYFQEEKICKWLTQLLLAIDYLHSNRILHGNLKLSNICITKENDVHLCDFGLSKLLNKEGIVSSFVGTPNYMCPELVSDLPYGYKSDIWSLGCCIFEIAAHQQPFRAPDMAGLINKINKSLISPLPIFYSSTLKQIIKSMLRKSPEHRPTAAELLRHPHLQPFVIQCRNPSAVFLPVKSPSSNNSKEKSKRPSPKSFDFGKDNKVGEPKLKQKDLLPFFERNSVSQYTNSLDGIPLIEEKLETKRVDPTSYDGKISHDSEYSETGLTTCETGGCNGGDDQDTFYFHHPIKRCFLSKIYVKNTILLPRTLKIPKILSLRAELPQMWSLYPVLEPLQNQKQKPMAHVLRNAAMWLCLIVSLVPTPCLFLEKTNQEHIRLRRKLKMICQLKILKHDLLQIQWQSKNLSCVSILKPTMETREWRVKSQLMIPRPIIVQQF